MKPLAHRIAGALLRALYRLRVHGAEHIPPRGAALLAPNHVSYIDALVICAASPRKVRFVMDHRIFASPWLGWLFRAAKAIPIAPAREDAGMLARAHEAIALALGRGELVCIFPEGRLSPDGRLGELRRGILDIVGRTPVPVVPVALRGLEASRFARCSGRTFWVRRPATRRIAVEILPPLGPQACSLDHLRARIAQALS